MKDSSFGYGPQLSCDFLANFLREIAFASLAVEFLQKVNSALSVQRLGEITSPGNEQEFCRASYTTSRWIVSM